ncbi:MAG: ATP-dependent zinc metalloprotease FtsH [Candidatus Aminicenantes bacterium]|nr:ATP-dependent zinc metalloprotease FtsH [Candidatus Aminicenantes bacterium]
MFWLASTLIIIFLWSILSDVKKGREIELKFSDFMAKVESKDIVNAFIDSNVVTGNMKSPGNMGPIKYKTMIPIDYPDLISILRENDVIIEVEELNKNQLLHSVLLYAPFLILIGIWIFMMRQQGGGGRGAFSFGKSKARMFTGERAKVTFKDVAGINEAKDEVEEIIAFLKDPKKFQRLGGKIPKGVLLIGLPGTGKTLLAKAIAGEAQVPFFTISGSDFVEMFVGVGASRVRDLFVEGKKHSPCLIFIDEIDAVGRQRGAGLGGGHDEREQTLNALLVEMDGFDPNEGVIIIAATNRPDILDTALLRPGRFDRRITVSTPDVKGREEILKVHTRQIPLAKTVNLSILARSTPGFTGADIANMVNEAALYASRTGKKKIEMDDFEYAKDKVLMGAERRSMIISDEEKKITAYHEAGHALIAAVEEEADPLHKVSIIPRGMALGVTQQLPINDKYTYSKIHLEAQLTVLLGGRVAEEVFLAAVTTGAGSDFERATSIARKMVCEWGMSSLGPIKYGKKDDMLFLGREMMYHTEYSEDTAKKIDREIEAIIEKAHKSAKSIILSHKENLEKIAVRLLEEESLTSKDIDSMLGIERKPEEPAVEKKPEESAVKEEPEKDSEKKENDKNNEVPAESNEG